MPVLAIPAAAIIIVALLAVLLLLAWQQFANAVSHLIPAWHIPGLGSLRGWLVDHIQDAYGAVAGYLDRYVKPMAAFVVAPIAVFTSMFTELGALDRAAFIFGTKIVTVTVPRAVSILRGEASRLEARVKSYALTLKAQAQLYAHDLTAHVEAEARSWALDARADAVRLADAAEAYAHAGDLAVAAGAVALYHDARTFAASLYNQATAFTRAEIAAAEADAVKLFRQAAATIELRYQSAIAYADQVAKAEATAVLTSLTGALVTDLDQLWPAVSGVIDDLDDVAAGAFTDVIDDLQALRGSTPATVPAAITTAIGLTIPMLRLARDCTIPNCRNLSEVGRDLQALFGVIESGALLGLVSAAAQDPEGVANVLEHTLGPLARAAVDQAESMVGAA